MPLQLVALHAQPTCNSSIVGLQPTGLGHGQCTAGGFVQGAVYAQIAVHDVGCATVDAVAQHADGATGASYSANGFSCVAVAQGPGSPWAAAWAGTYYAFSCTSGAQEIAFNAGTHYIYAGQRTTVATPTPTACDQSTIASTLASPSDAFASASHDIAVLGVAAAATLFITFPAQLFNHTLQENEEQILAMFGWLRHKKKAASTAEGDGAVTSGGSTDPTDPTDQPTPVPADEEATRPHTDRARFTAVVAVGALFGGLLDPHFGIDGRSLETYVAMIAATLWGINLSRLVAQRYRRSAVGDVAFGFTSLPFGLLIALGCVLVSRATSLEPGYLYGVVAGVAFTATITERQEAHIATLTVHATLIGAVVAWGLWDLLNGYAAHAGADFPAIIADDFFASVFAGGLTGSVIGLFPMSFLPGGRIAAWNKMAWAATFLLAVFGLTGVIIWPHRGGHPGTAPVTTIVLFFLGFGGLSVGTWWYFERRKRQRADGAVAVPEAVAAEPAALPEVPPGPAAES